MPKISRLLVELSPDAQDRIRAVVAACPRFSITAGTTRSAVELPHARLLVVEEGTAFVAAGRNGRRRALVAIVGPGGVLAPPAVGEELGAVVSATITAVTTEALAALTRDPEAAALVLDALVDAIRDREETAACLARSPANERVRGKLLQLARSHGKVTENGIVIDLPLKHELLAEMIGSTRETVTWALQELAREGFATRDGRVYRLDVAPAELAGR